MIDTSKIINQNNFTLYHVFMQAAAKEREYFDVAFLQAYDGKKCPNLDYLLEEVEVRGQKRRRCEHICMDCGAYEASVHGYDIEIDPYIDYCNKYSDYLDWFCALDYIPRFNRGNTVQEEAKYSGEETWRRFLYMWDRVKNPEKMAWVYHGPEPLENIYRAMTWKDPKTGKGIGVLGFGMSSSSDTERDISLLSYINRAVKETGYKGKIHLLGLQREKIVALSPYITSSDSSSSIRFAVSGVLNYQNLQIKVSKTTKLNHKEGTVNTIYNPHIKAALVERIKELGLGYDIDNLTTAQIWYWSCIERTLVFNDVAKTRKTTKRGLLCNIKK